MPSFPRLTAPLLGALAAVGLAAQAYAAPAHNLPDSFLPTRAASISQLVQQVQTNPTVRRHYASYFHIPESRIAKYLRQNLVASRLSRGGQYTVYLVRQNSLIYPVMVHLPAGSRVFALRSGPAVMTSGDGNPLRRFEMAQETHYIKPAKQQIIYKVSPSRQQLAPIQVHETILPTVIYTPVFQPTNGLTPAEQQPGEETASNTPAPAAPANP